MYQAEIEVAKHQSRLIHHERQSYNKTEKTSITSTPLSLQMTAANVHDKWLADDLIISIVVPRPDPDAVEQHICMDKGYDYPDVHTFVETERYVVHIKHRRRRGEPVVEACPIPGETQFPARRWVVERTLGWLVKRRSLRVRWCKYADNWLAFIQLASAHILMDMAVYG